VSAPTRSKPGAFDRVIASGWPPVAGMMAAVVVFLGVLLTSPPGLASFGALYLPNAADPVVLADAYVLGAAAGWALVALVAVTFVGGLVVLARSQLQTRDTNR
jgi:hypothetical protein